MRRIVHFLILLPVFSLTSFIGLPRLQNIAVVILVVGLTELALRRKNKLSIYALYSWLIALGLGGSIFLRFLFGSRFSYTELLFPLIWSLMPLFLRYWNRSLSSLWRFPDILFFLNFFYACLQLVAIRFSNYSLMIHRNSTDYQIVKIIQDTPFSYLGLNNLHELIGSHVGATVTGLVTERVDLMLLCILCILKSYPFSFSKRTPVNYSKIRFFRLLPRINIILALFLLITSGSSLSIFILFIPFLIIAIQISDKGLKQIKVFKLSKTLRVIISIGFFIILIFVILFYSFSFLSKTVSLFDQSRRIAALGMFASVFEYWTDYFGELLYGSGVVATSDLEGFHSTGESLLPRSLDIFGYTFNSFGLLGLVPFLACYPLLLRVQTSLKWLSIIIFCALAFTAAGSPINYIYTYALILIPYDKTLNTQINK